MGPSDAQPVAGFLGEAFTISFSVALAKGALWLHTREHGGASSRGPTARWDVTGEQQAEPGRVRWLPCTVRQSRGTGAGRGASGAERDPLDPCPGEAWQRGTGHTPSCSAPRKMPSVGGGAPTEGDGGGFAAGEVLPLVVPPSGLADRHTGASGLRIMALLVLWTRMRLLNPPSLAYVQTSAFPSCLSPQPGTHNGFCPLLP